MIQEATMAAFFLVFLTGLFVTAKTKFVQFSSMGKIVSKLFYIKNNSNSTGLNPRQAMFITLSTTVGIGTVVGPIVAITFGGPGALLWFALCSIVSSGVIYTEVILAFKNRDLSNKDTAIGPMAHLRKISPWMALAYAISTTALLMAWNASQASILAKVGAYSFPISKVAFAFIISISAVLINERGVPLIRSIMDKMVPSMIMAYIGAVIMNITYNYDNIIPCIKTIVGSFFALKSTVYGVGTFSMLQACRWGVARCLSAVEAGCGTSSIAHSMSSGNAKEQAKIAVFASIINCIVGFLSAFGVMVSHASEKYPFLTDIDLIEKAFSVGPLNIGIFLIRFAIFLFAYGTIIGNCFNAKICFEYAFNKKISKLFMIISGGTLIAGSFCNLKAILEIADLLFLLSLTLQMSGIFYWWRKNPDLFK